MNATKYVKIILCFFLIGGCSLFDNDENPKLGVCTENLYEEVKNTGSIAVIATYDMDYKSETELTESEIQEQRAAISNMHEIMIQKLLAVNVTNPTTNPYRPRISFFATKEAFLFICNDKQIKEVQKNYTNGIN